MKTIVNKIEKWYLLILVLVVLVIVFATVQIFDKLMKNQQETEMTQLSTVISSAIRMSLESESLVQEFWIEKLEGLSKEIASEIGLLDLESLSPNDLEAIKESYALSGVALFKDLGEDVQIVNSTHDNEIGLSTKNWGFWHRAFRALFDEGKVDIGRGFSNGPFWAGPRSLAYDQDGYFLFTYYKMPDQPFLLNLYINDMKAFGVLKNNDPNRLINQLTLESNFIKEIAVINTEAWNNRFLEENRRAIEDFTVLYGHYTSFSAEDTYYLNQMKNAPIGSKIRVDIKNKEEKYSKFYKNMGPEEVIIFTIDHKALNALKNNMILTILSGIVSVVLIGFLFLMFYTRHYSALLNIERKRLATAERFKETVQLLPNLVFRLKQVDGSIWIEHCEGQGIMGFGTTPEMAENKSFSEVIPDKYLKAMIDYVENAFKGQGGNFTLSIGKQSFDFHAIPIAKSNNSEVLLFANDVTRLRASEERSKYLAYHDSLTGLPNRLMFREHIETQLTSKSAFAIAFIDMDGFKEVNDTAGHDVGDLLIVEVGRRLSACIGSLDFCARMGGDEFAIYSDAPECEDLLSKIQFELSKPYALSGFDFQLTASIGVSRFPDNGADYTSLLKTADIAMYRVKNSGKNNFDFFKEDSI